MSLVEYFGLGEIIVNHYLRMFLVLIVLLVILRIMLYFVSRILIKLTSKTATTLDDILVQKFSVPFTIFAFLISLRISLEEIILEEVLSANIERIIYSAIVVLFGYGVYIFIDVVLFVAWRKVTSRTKTKIDESLNNVLHGILKISLIILAVLYILSLWGIEIVPLLGALGIAGLAVALALQPVLGNIFSGVAMVLDKSARVGDWIILENGNWGVIEKFGIRSTKIRSFDNELIVIPNSKMADSMIHNVSLPDPQARVVVPFSVAYGSDVNNVKKIVMKEIEKIDKIAKHPEPSVKFLEMGDSALIFKAFFYIESFENRYSALDEANTRIYNALNRAGIEIPFPQMDIHLKKQ